MSNGTVAAILGTVIGLGAGVGGMVMFGNIDDGLEEDFATISDSNTRMIRELDNLKESSENDLTDLDRKLAKLKLELENERKVTKDLLSERDDNPNAKAATAAKSAIKAKDNATASDEANRQAQAKVSAYEKLMLEKGIYDFLTVEELEARKTELKGKFDTAMAGKDKAVAMASLKDLQKLGPKFFDEAIEMWSVLADDFGIGENRGKGAGGLGMSFQEFATLVPNFEMIEYALTNNDTSSEFRSAMLNGLGWRTSEDADKRVSLAGNVLLNDNEAESRAAVRALSSIDTPSSVRYLNDFLTSNTSDADGRKRAIRALQQKDTGEAWAAIESAAQNDTDPEVKAVATQALNRGNAEVAGLQVTWVGENSQASLAGIKVDDIMTKYNGKAIRSLSDLSVAKKSVSDGQSVKVVLYRDSKYITLTIGPGQIGINGTEVKPKK